MADITTLLAEWRRGDPEAMQRLAPLVYDELRHLAACYMRRERPDHTLQSTALVHEAFMKLSGNVGVDWESRSHFFGIAARVIRQLLVDHARASRAAKRGAGVAAVPIQDVANAIAANPPQMLALDDALSALAEIDPRQAQIVEMRFFAGLTVEETAELLGISEATVKREWNSARAFLQRELTR